MLSKPWANVTRSIVAVIMLLVVATSWASPASASTTLTPASKGVFGVPTDGYMGYGFTSGHRGIDIWTGKVAKGCGCADPAGCSGAPGNAIYAVYDGFLEDIYWGNHAGNFRTIDTSKVANPDKWPASVVVIRHENVPGVSGPIYTLYQHLAEDTTSASFVDPALIDAQGKPLYNKVIKRGDLLGRQGNWKYYPQNDYITHLHFEVAYKDGTLPNRTTVDPMHFLGLPYTHCGGAAFTVNSQPPEVARGGVNGQVLLSTTRAPVPGATVKVSGGGFTAETQTNGEGRYSFTGVPAGPVKLIASKADVGEGATDFRVEANLDKTAPDLLLQATCTPGAPSGPGQPCAGNDIALIIDSSGSMLSNDPTNLRLAAAKVFVQSMSDNDRVTVIDFDSSARNVWSLSGVAGVRDQITTKITQSINSSGGTNISAGLRLGYQQLNDGASRTKVAVLLTDGQHTSGAYDPQWQQAFVTQGWRVYTFGLSAEADTALLGTIAAETGGSFEFLNDAGQLSVLYNKLRTTISSSRTVAEQRFTMFTGQSVQFTLQLPPSTRVANFVTTWPGSQVLTALQSPDGQLIYAERLEGSAYAVDKTFEVFRVPYPMAGEWTVILTGVSLAPAGEEVTVQVDTTASWNLTRLPLLMR